MTEHPRFPSSLTTKVMRMRENSRQLEERSERRRRWCAGLRVMRGRRAAPRLLRDDGRARLRAPHCQGRLLSL